MTRGLNPYQPPSANSASASIFMQKQGFGYLVGGVGILILSIFISGYFLAENYPIVSRFCRDQNIDIPASLSTCAGAIRFIANFWIFLVGSLLAVIAINERFVSIKHKPKARCGIGVAISVFGICMAVWIVWTTTSALTIMEQ